MRILIELETDAEGRAIRAKIVGGGVFKPRKERRRMGVKSERDTQSVRLVHDFISRHGVSEAARMLGITRYAIYQWVNRGTVPWRHVENIERINAELGVDSTV
jgi:DNA invertase Pin-like site-specific DNA recombinase